MGGRPRVVGLLAVVAAVLMASQLTASPACAQMRIPLFSDAKPKIVKKRPFRPTLPNRNPLRVTADVSADTVAPPKAENSDVSAAVGTASSASATVAAVAPAADEPTAATAASGSEASAPASSESASDSADTNTSQSDEAASPTHVAALSNDADSDAAASDDKGPTVSASDESAGDDSAGDTTGGITPHDAGDDAASATETTQTPQADDSAATPAAQEPASSTAGAEEAAAPAADEPAAAPAEQTTETAADDAPGAPADTAPASAEDDAAAPDAATDASDETAPTPAETTSADNADEAPAVTEPADASPAAESEETTETASHDASVVLEVSPPPTDVEAATAPANDETPPETKKTQTAALTPPNAPVPDQASAAEDEAPAAAEAEPGSDAAESDKAATAPEEGAEPASAAPAEPEPAEVAPPPAHPVVAAIRAKLDEPDFEKSVPESERKALQAFYGTREEPPLWVTDAGFSDKAKALIAEIGKADDWGLEASDFNTPRADARFATEEEQAAAELKLDLAALKYARYAEGGRRAPSSYSPLFDQRPPISDPKTVLTELAAAPAPDAYLASLQPQHEQFKALRQALLKARAQAKAAGRNPNNDRDVQLIVMNMERWRWLPRQLGTLYVWDNVPEFNTRVIKNGKTIYVEKTIVGQVKYATPFFSAPMRNIVFHPDWTVPPTIVNEDLAPSLQGGGGFFGNANTAILRNHGLKVSLKGEPIDPDTVDWKNVNVRSYTFTQDPGPDNVLGQLKFNFPNRHAIYMHDTVQPELFDETVRALSHGCIRVKNPDKFAALLLAQDKGWPAAQVNSLLAKGDTSVVGLNRLIPVHITYFTAVADEHGNIDKLGDIYGIDNRMAAKMFANPARFPVPAAPEDIKVSSGQDRSRGGGFESIISGLFGN